MSEKPWWKSAHPALPEVAEQLRREEIGRREFVRTATLLGMSAGAAYALAGELSGTGIAGKAQAQDGTPQMGGSLRVGMRVQEMKDPAVFDWTEKSNQARHILEYLAHTDENNVTTPYLLESWQPSEDLKTWTLNLRQGVKWNNGDDFVAEDVAHNFRRWIDPETGSSNAALFSPLPESGIEVADPHTVVLHLDKPLLAVPENLYNYPTAIVHRSFDEMGADLEANPIGTGPFELAEFAVGGICRLRKRNPADYWGDEVYLDEIVYSDFGEGTGPTVQALLAGEVDTVYEIGIDEIAIVEEHADLEVLQAITAQTGVARMRVTEAPFDDVRVRQAVVACMDHARLLDVGYQGRGAPAENHHVCPIHPEYFALPRLRQDYDRARALLAEAGHGDGLNITIDVRNAPSWESNTMQAFKEMLEPAGINLTLNVMPDSQFWEIWDKTPFGFTAWTHRPLGVMVLNLAYRSGEAWNRAPMPIRSSMRRSTSPTASSTRWSGPGRWKRSRPSCRTTRWSPSRCGARCSPPPTGG
ncbi:MAG: ABC transporter substrate-binding protein [Alphaproteobacteria bacterium]